MDKTVQIVENLSQDVDGIPRWTKDARFEQLSLLEGSSGTGRPMGAYAAFEDKFKPRLTTDDCYTPPMVYDAVAAWAVKEYGWGGVPVLRPFYPGGDFEREAYPPGCVVIDNPPFSILTKICRWYNARGIDYFLFCPGLTCLNLPARCHIGVGISVIYANGAKVNTSFVCSRGPALRTAPDLYNAIEQAMQQTRTSKELPSYDYPPDVITAARLNYLSKYGVDFRADRGQAIKELDAGRREGKSIFGGGWLLPRTEAAHAARAVEAAQSAAAARVGRDVKKTTFQLSARERAIQNEMEEGAEDHA